MASLLIRHVDDQLMRELKRRAAAEHRSVQQLVRDVLLEVVRAPKHQQPLTLFTVDTGRSSPMSREEIAGEDERG